MKKQTEDAKNDGKRTRKNKNRNDFVEFMSTWKSMMGEYLIRIPLYSFISFIFISMAYSAIIDSWGNNDKTLELVVGFGLIIFSVFIVIVVVLGALDTKDRETKAFGYRVSEEPLVLEEIEKILRELGLKYHKTGPKWNLMQFIKYSEVYCLDGWTIRCFSYRARKGPYYEAVFVEIGPVKEHREEIERIKHALDARLEPFYLG